MENKRILSLDVSTKTGWALIVSSNNNYDLEAFGQEGPVSEPIGVPYPESYVDWAYECYGKIVELIDRHAPDVLVIEETSGGSKNAFSQKILEYIHFLLAQYIKQTGIRAVYVLTEEWRRHTGCKMTKDESKHNKLVREYKKKNKSRLAYDESGKIMGIKTRKHINVRRANELFNLTLKQGQNDTADAILLAYYYHVKSNA